MSADQIESEKMEYFKNLHAYLLDHGIYLGPSGYEVGFVSDAHSYADLDFAIETIIAGIDKIMS